MRLGKLYKPLLVFLLIIGFITLLGLQAYRESFGIQSFYYRAQPNQTNQKNIPRSSLPSSGTLNTVTVSTWNAGGGSWAPVSDATLKTLMASPTKLQIQLNAPTNKLLHPQYTNPVNASTQRKMPVSVTDPLLANGLTFTYLDNNSFGGNFFTAVGQGDPQQGGANIKIDLNFTP